MANDDRRQTDYRMTAHERICEERHTTINRRLQNVEEAVAPIPVMADNLRTITRIMWVIGIGILGAVGTLVWSAVARHAGGV